VGIEIKEKDFDLESYDYFLAKGLIAQYPSAERDKSRLLVYHRKENKVEHRFFSEIVNYFSPGDCLVLNRTKVIPARLIGKKDTGGMIEVLLLDKISPKLWKALVNSQVTLEKKIFFPESLQAIIKEKTKECLVLEFNFPVYSFLEEIGEVPLPSYIKRKGNNDKNKLLDRERYQTVYAQEEGAIAAPTAGLHFTQELLKKLVNKGVEVVSLLLHIGPATFQPVKSEDIRKHHLEEEYFFLPSETVEAINFSKKKNKKVVACGTSVVRVLEGQTKNGILQPSKGYTNFYIYPGYQFQIIDGLITNFHLPKSTNLILISSFIGQEKVLQLYQEAKEKNYRFYSYGDAMFIS